MEYKTIVFIDTNVVLQCLDLRQLPWFEIDRIGPVLVLITPTVLQEVDSKKQDQRLADHARRFNTLLRPLLGAQETVNVRPSPAPQVDIALARCSPIQWQSFPELERIEPDARIVAEALHTEVSALARKVFVSQDIRPLDLARRHGIQIHHVEKNWLRPKEISEAEKKVSALSKELASQTSKQPELHLNWGLIPASVEVINLKRLSEIEREAALGQIRCINPIPTQERQTERVNLFLNNYDYTLDRRYEKWSEYVLPAFMREFEEQLELQYNQIEVLFTLKNVANVQAESLLLEITATGGWMNDKLILIPPGGPPSPRPRGIQFDYPQFHNFHKPSPPRGKHDVVIEKSPKRSNYVRITCDDFRQGSQYEYKFVAWLDPHSEATFELEAVATASKLYGNSTCCFSLQKQIIDLDVFDLVDRSTMKYLKQSLAESKLRQNEGDDYSAFEFEKYADKE